MDRKAKVELFEQIRREYNFGEGSTVRGIARQFNVHRRMVRQAIATAIPPERKVSDRATPRLSPAQPFIDGILESDRLAPRKQRHTAHRIWVRLCQERPNLAVAESTVRQYVRERKQELGLLVLDTHVPQDYQPGQEAQVDWYEAFVVLGGERIKVQLFAMRSMNSGGGFHCAYLSATQQAFLEAHEKGFAYFGGVFRTLRYDNLTSAVKKVLRGHTREETTRFVGFRSHWKFAAEFCTPASPTEKGGVEGELGYFRRNHLVPLPVVDSLEALNQLLLAGCRVDEARLIGDRHQNVGVGMVSERSVLLPLECEGFDLAEVRSAIVDGKGCIRVHGNSYSVPLSAGTRASVRVLPSTISVWHSSREVASHPRSYGQGNQFLDLTHYLDVLYRKPGALAGSRPLAQWRVQGKWPPCFDTLLKEMKSRCGDSVGTRQMVELLQLGCKQGFPMLVSAVEETLNLGSYDAAVVQSLLAASTLTKSVPSVPLSVEQLGALSRYERPLPDVTG